MWCVNYCAIFSQNCWVAALCLYVQQSVRTSLSVNSFTIEVNSKITTSSLFAYCWLDRKNKPGNLAQCKTEKCFQGIRISIFTTISTVFGSNYTCPTRQITLCSTLLITYTSDFVTLFVPVSLMQKNSQGCRITDSLCPLGGNDTVMYYWGKYFAIEGRLQFKCDCLVSWEFWNLYSKDSLDSGPGWFFVRWVPGLTISKL